MEIQFLSCMTGGAAVKKSGYKGSAKINIFGIAGSLYVPHKPMVA